LKRFISSSIEAQAVVEFVIASEAKQSGFHEWIASSLRASQ